MHSVLSAPPSTFAPCQPVRPSEQVFRPVGESTLPRTCGIITIQNESYSPKNERSAPPSITDSMGWQVSVEMARAYNMSEHAQQKKRWALVTASGGVLFICGVSPEERPNSNRDYPACVQGGMTMEEALKAAAEQNQPRFEHARIPRFWTVAVRPLNDEMIGGAA